ncbi:MAG: alpha/beta hydrolase [Deltaproteobacteria bacterium]
MKSPIIILVHGVLGHFLARGTPRQLPGALAENGINSFSINTRMAYLGQINGNAIFDKTVYDIDAALDYLREEGFLNIFILGFSLGANLAAYHNSIRTYSELKGIILEGCAYSLPDSQKRRWDKWKSIPSYGEVYEKAIELLAPDPISSRNDRIFLVNRAWGDTLNPFHNEIFTYKTWWFMRSPEAENAKTYKIIPEMKTPLLLLQGEHDDILDDWECRELARSARESGNGAVEFNYIPGAKHDCMENAEATVNAISVWVKTVLKRQKLKGESTG